MAATSSALSTVLDVQSLRRDFPILETAARGAPLVYLDNAATSQKPRQVIDAVRAFYEESNANIHRGVHYLSERASELYEMARHDAQRFLGARHAHEVVFTRGTTEGVNLVASGFGEAILQPGDEVLVSDMEHHSNLVPWQRACARSGARIVAVPVTERGELDFDALVRLTNSRTRLIAITWVSNAIGTINPVGAIASHARTHGIPLFLDGAQAAPHLAVDVARLGCDFFVCSGHKMLGPTGAGILYGTTEWLERLPPYQTGGGMIDYVAIERSTWAKLPAKFEAGTPDIAAAIGLSAAIAYLEGIGMEKIAAHEIELGEYAIERLQQLPYVRVIGLAAARAGVVSFVVDGIHPHDVGTILDQHGVAVRAGHHCCQPLMRRFGVPATVRASFYVYNTRDEVDALIRGVEQVRRVFG